MKILIINFFFERFLLKLDKLGCLTKTTDIFQNELKFLVNMPLPEKNMSGLTQIALSILI